MSAWVVRKSSIVILETSVATCVSAWVVSKYFRYRYIKKSYCEKYFKNKICNSCGNIRTIGGLTPKNREVTVIPQNDVVGQHSVRYRQDLFLLGKWYARNPHIQLILMQIDNYTDSVLRFIVKFCCCNLRERVRCKSNKLFWSLFAIVATCVSVYVAST